MKRKMTVIFGKVHDLTKTDVGYKLIDVYANVAHEEVTFTLNGVCIKKHSDDRVIIEASTCQKSELEEFESSILENMESVFEGKLSGLSLAKLYVSSVTDDGIVVDLEDDTIEFDDEHTYDVVLICENIFITKGNSSFGSPLKIKSITLTSSSPRAELCP